MRYTVARDLHMHRENTEGPVVTRECDHEYTKTCWSRETSFSFDESRC
jgi:hypothetical protein